MAKNSPLSLIMASTLALLLSSGISMSQEADTVLKGGKILTVDDDFNVVENLAILDGRIIAVGEEAVLTDHIGNNTKIIELDGKTVMPGLIDNHLHFIRGAWNFQNEARLDGINSRVDALKALEAKAKNAAPGEWVTVIGGWSLFQFHDDDSPFTLEELDAVAPDTPIYLMQNYSNGYVNSAAYKAAGIEVGDAKLSGRENLTPFTNMVTWRNKSSSETTILAYMNELNSVGLTTVYDVGRVSEGNLEPLAALADKRQLPLRVFHTLRYTARDKAAADEAIATISGDDIKPLSKDAQFGLLGLGEHIYVPVSDNPKHAEDWANDVWQPFSDISWAAAENGWPVHEHVMSRSTAQQYLDLVEQIAMKIPEVKNLRWTFAHVNGMEDEDIARAQKYGIALAVHSQARMGIFGMDSPRIGSIERSGALWGLGSDAGIVAPYNPFFTLEWAVAGTNVSGTEGWSEDQRISREAALIAHTRNNAEMLFIEDDLGSLEVGKLADLIVLDGDYLTVPSTEISEIRPVLTITNGEIVHQSN